MISHVIRVPRPPSPPSALWLCSGITVTTITAFPSPALTGFLQLQRRDFSLQQRLLLPAQALGNMGSVVVARGHWSTGTVVAVYRLVCVYSGSSYSEFSGLPGSGCLFPSPGKFSATFPSNNFSCPFSSSGSL